MCRLRERKRSRDTVGVCVGYVKRRERGIVWVAMCVCYVKGRDSEGQSGWVFV